MLTERQLELFGDQMAGLYQAFEQDVISDIARRVKKTGRFTETAELMAQSMHNAGASPYKIRTEVMKVLRADPEYKKFVANNTKQHKREVMGKIRAMEKAAREKGDEIIANAGNMAFNADLAMWHQHGAELTMDSSITRLIAQMSAVTAGTFKNITKTIGFKGPHDFASIQNAYISALDKAVLKMATGTFSFDQAANDCVREMARSGLRTVDYASGRSYQLDTAARMCIRTSCHQLSAKMSMQNCDNMGTDLVEVSSHWGAREDHAAWQGKVYSRSGKDKRYPKFDVCRYGEVDGLCGVNCRHNFFPFFEGSVPNTWPPEPGPKKYGGKDYTYTQATQKQRQMERNIRATKREIEAAKALGEDTAELRSKLKRQTGEYHTFSGAMDIRAKDNRLRVVAGSSELSKIKTWQKVAKSGASGAYTNKTDPLGIKREEHAIKYYQQIRNRKPEYVISALANNANISETSARNIYNHIFVSEHLFKDGTNRMFDPDYDMSESFRRILEGKNIREHDIVMIKHENLELNLMKKYNMSYEDAHNLTVKKYDYSSALNKFLREVES